MITHYLKVALRNLLKYRTHSLISALCLAVGITFFTLVSHFINGVLNQHNFPRAEERISFNAMKGDYGQALRWEDVGFLQSQHITGIDSLFATTSITRNGEVTLFDNNQREFPFLVKYKMMSPNYFANRDIELAHATRSLEDIDEVVVSESFVRRSLDGKSPVGLILRVDAGLPESCSIKNFKIVNVAKVDESMQLGEIFFHPDVAPKWKYSVESFLNGEASFEEVNKQLSKIVWPEGRITSCWAWQEGKDATGEAMVALLVRALSSLILLSGLINFLKFIIQMFYNRQRELNIRQCLGSDWKGMFSLLFAEVFWMVSVAFLLSLLISEISIAFINHIIPSEELMVTYSMDRVIVQQSQVYLGVLIVCLVIILFPVYKLRKTSVIRPVLQRSRKHIFRYTMIGLQLAISIFFVGGVWTVSLFFDEFIGEAYKPLSVEEEQQILTVPISSERLRSNWDEILQKIQGIPGYEEHTYFTSQNELKSFSYMEYTKDDKETMPVIMQQGDPNSFGFFHIPMAGQKGVTAESNRVYVSERFMARLQADGNTGTVRLNGNDYQVAGVYKELYRRRETNAEHLYAGTIFLPADEKGCCFLKFTSGTNMSVVRNNVESICREYIPYTLPLEIVSLDEVTDDMVDTIVLLMKCGIILGIVSLILVVLSVYSAISIDTVGRQKEIAIRKINGATSRNIASLFAKPYVVVYLLSFVFVYPLLRVFLIELTQGQANVAYQWGWGIGLFFGFALLLLIITVHKIRRIMYINPATIIKKE